MVGSRDPDTDLDGDSGMLLVNLQFESLRSLLGVLSRAQ